MNKILLDKYKNDPTWSETIKLYSGLFDSQDKREDFILNIAESDILLSILFLSKVFKRYTI